jgi:serine/threonine-protein kinase
VLAVDLEASAYTCLIYSSFTVFTRALIVPSSARRTAVISSLAFVPTFAGAIVLVNLDEFQSQVPAPMFVGGALLYQAVAVLLAMTGSRIIYGLRKQVTEAMQLGEYTLDRKIGEGGMGAVYRARHALLRRPTAIKLLLPEKVGPENLDRFEREVQHMSQLTHPNTVTVFDYGRSPDGVLYYAMEYLGGIDLEQLVKRFGPQPAGRVAKILIQVCGALQEAHDAKIIHRDIKPANIILCERGGVPDVAKVVDFGLVREITRDSSASAQVVMGTPHYLAPEAITDPDTLGPAVDIYSLGAVGFYLLTGRHVFDGKTSVQVCLQQVTDPAPRPTEVAKVHVPRELEDQIMKCLSKSPSARPSAAALSEALEALPKPRDWDPKEAQRWWREFKTAETAPASDAQTLTITIDLQQRT